MTCRLPHAKGSFPVPFCGRPRFAFGAAAVLVETVGAAAASADVGTEASAAASTSAGTEAGVSLATAGGSCAKCSSAAGRDGVAAGRALLVAGEAGYCSPVIARQLWRHAVDGGNLQVFGAAKERTAKDVSATDWLVFVCFRHCDWLN